MNDFLLGVKVGAGIIVFVAIAFGLIAAVYGLAKNNIIFTIVPEGRAKAILRFGEFRKIKMSYKGHMLDVNWNVIPGGGFKEWLSGLFGGLRIVGIPFVDSVHKYKFKWTSYEQITDDGKTAKRPKTKEEMIDFILVQDDVYYTVVEDVKAKGMAPVNVIVLLTLRVINPYMALFRIQHWLEATQNRIAPAYRPYVSARTYEELTEQKEEVDQVVGSFIQQSQIDDFVKNNYGVEMVAAEMAEINVHPEFEKEITEAATRKWRAEKQLDEVTTLADAEVARIGKVYDKIVGYGQQGLYLRTLETLEKAGQEPGKFVVFPLGGIKDLIQAWTGKGVGT